MTSTSSPAPLGVGIVGLSATDGWAASAHVPALAALNDYELRALTASSPESSRAAGAKYEVPASASVEELAARAEVDLVAITVKVPQHRELILPALDSGKVVFSEWPLGRNLAEAEQITAAAEAKGVHTVVGLQARCAPPVRYVRDLIVEGYLGDVLSSSLVASGARWGAETDNRGAYLLDADNGATMLTIPFGHTIDAFTMVLGEFAEVSATTATRRPKVANADTHEAATMTAEDQVAISGVLAGGAVASVHFRGGLSRGTNFRWEINGTEGDLVLTGDTGHLQFGQVTVHGARGDATAMTELAVPDRYAHVTGVEATSPAYAVAHAYAQLRADLTDGTSVVPDFAHAVRTHRLLDRIQRAAATGQRQILDQDSSA